MCRILSERMAKTKTIDRKKKNGNQHTYIIYLVQKETPVITDSIKRISWNVEAYIFKPSTNNDQVRYLIKSP